MKVAVDLRQVRITAKVTLQESSHESGLSPARLSALERGQPALNYEETQEAGRTSDEAALA